MDTDTLPARPTRYEAVHTAKATGSTYTPPAFADFVASQIVQSFDFDHSKSEISVLDPAVGDGALALALLRHLKKVTTRPIRLVAFDTNPTALQSAQRRVFAEFPDAALSFRQEDFVEWAAETKSGSLFTSSTREAFDLIIANPPYVRTQVMGSATAQILAQAFGLTGRVDLYHAFLMAMTDLLSPTGAAGVIVSNRFMTTKGAGALRGMLRSRWHLKSVWDFGDTKLFDAAVLPAVVVATGLETSAPSVISFASIYESKGSVPTTTAPDAVTAVEMSGMVELDDGRVFDVHRGTLASTDGGDTEGVWCLASETSNAWLETVAAKTWSTFAHIGKIRVGVKTCADKVFIKKGWLDEADGSRPELVRRLTTHHVARRFKPQENGPWRGILYPHQVNEGVRSATSLDSFPKSAAYLEQHRQTLEGRTYLMEAGRRWYELWVPQDPAAWARPKLVFRDISEQPTFWLDLAGTVINGDCYWLVPDSHHSDDLLWLAMAVANSKFAEAFYDRSFNNKLYGGKRRFITQYVERFPLPDPEDPLSQEMIRMAKDIYGEIDVRSVAAQETKLDQLVWSAFGLSPEETTG